MALEVSFTRAQMKAAIELPSVNAVVFKPMFNDSNEVNNICMTPVSFNASTNKFTEVGMTFSTARKKKLIQGLPVVFIKNRSTQNVVQCIPGTSNYVQNPSIYSEVDQFMVRIKQGLEAPTSVFYEIVFFTKTQIIQVFKESGSLPAEGNISKLILRHMLTDMGVNLTGGNGTCRKCVSLYAVGKQSDGGLAEVQIPGGYNAVQIGQPCPPDWWYKAVYVFTTG